MKVASLAQVNLLDFGNEVTSWGLIFHGKDKAFVMPFPDAERDALETVEHIRLDLKADEYAALLSQLDMQNVETITKAIVRKSQRRIDQNIAWECFARDEYRCRYCYARKPLTVDHVDLWENGGATVVANLISACGPCNKTRGRMEYEVWIASKKYAARSVNLPLEWRQLNLQVADNLPYLRTLRVEHTRSR